MLDSTTWPLVKLLTEFLADPALGISTPEFQAGPGRPGVNLSINRESFPTTLPGSLLSPAILSPPPPFIPFSSVSISYPTQFSPAILSLFTSFIPSLLPVYLFPRRSLLPCLFLPPLPFPPLPALFRENKIAQPLSQRRGSTVASSFFFSLSFSSSPTWSNTHVHR